MRIGEFSKKYQISVDNIYFYIKSGLLVPIQRGKQYFFDPVCERDLEHILMFKSLGFSLKEIHSILSLYRISGKIYPEDAAEVMGNLQKKYDDLLQQKIELEEAMQKIIYTKENIAKSINQKQKSHTGVPTAMLELLQCPICGGELYLQNTELNQRYVFHSDLNCDCGYHAQIQDGILLTSNKNQSKYDRPDLTREYYKDIPADLTSLFQKSYNWMQDQMQIDNWNNKVILETHINAYFYLQVALDRLDKNAKYIIIDKYPEMLKLYKGLIDSTDSNFNILYIADASLDFPIRKNSVDLFIDYFSSNEYQFSNHHWLIHLITPYMKKDGLALGTYFYFNKGKKSIQNLLNYYPEAYEQNFNLPLFLNALQQDWSILNQTNIGFTTQTGTNWAFNYHVDGEEMHLFSYLARLKLK